jgi:hypothetical protein
MIEQDTNREDNGSVSPSSESEGSDTGVEVQQRIASLEAAVLSGQEEAALLKGALAAAVAKYREAMLSRLPQIPEELVRGETVDEIDASLELATQLVSRVRQQLEAEESSRAVPAGAPPRTTPDLSALAPSEKIAYGLAQR